MTNNHRLRLAELQELVDGGAWTLRAFRRGRRLLAEQDPYLGVADHEPVEMGERVGWVGDLQVAGFDECGEGRLDEWANTVPPLGIVFCLAPMIGMGPHNLFLADDGTIAPLALVGFALEVTFIVHALRLLRASQ